MLIYNVTCIDMTTCISGKNKLYIHCYNSGTANIDAVKLELSICQYLKIKFDTISIYDIDIHLRKKFKKNYNLVLINATAISYAVTKIELNKLVKKLKFLSNCQNVVLLTHDLHDHSFIKSEWCFNLNLDMNDKKKLIKILFEKLNIKHFISIYDCPELNFWTKSLFTTNNFYLINHGYPNNIFYPSSTIKRYDILFYGASLDVIYPFRSRLLNIIRNNPFFRLRIIDKSEKIKEHKLSKLINESWLVIACVSIFSYFVRKYVEISACNSVVVGDINSQGHSIIDNNIVLLNNNMLDNEIINKINHYLQNKEILSALSFNKHEKLINESYDHFCKKINIITDSILNNEDCCYKFIEKESFSIDYNTIHTSTPLSIVFVNNNNIWTSLDDFDIGLYVIKIKNDNAKLFDIFDIKNNKLTNCNTYITDINSTDIYWISFKITSITKIIISDYYEDSKIYIIKY